MRNALPALHPSDAELPKRVAKALAQLKANPHLLFDVRWRLAHKNGAEKKP